MLNEIIRGLGNPSNSKQHLQRRRLTGLEAMEERRMFAVTATARMT